MTSEFQTSRRALLFGLAASITGVAACGGGDNSTPTSPTPTYIANVPFSTTELTAGTGAQAAAGMSANVDYIGWLYSTAATDNKGTVFDASCQTVCTPITYVVGSNQLIRGFDQAVQGMLVGGIRRAIIPPELAYGASGSQGGAVPPNATIIFEIRLNSLTSPT